PPLARKPAGVDHGKSIAKARRPGIGGRSGAWTKMMASAWGWLAAARSAAFALVFAAAPAAAFAGEIADRAAEAERLLGEGKSVDAQAAFDKAAAAFWIASPLQLR